MGAEQENEKLSRELEVLSNDFNMCKAKMEMLTQANLEMMADLQHKTKEIKKLTLKSADIQ